MRFKQLIILVTIAIGITSNTKGEPQRIKYTSDEIDELHRVCETKWLYGTCNPKGQFSRQYQPEEKEVAVWQMVRTYIIAGLKATDICK